MNMSSPSLIVKDVFLFSDGRTIFTGNPLAEYKLFPAGKYELLINNQVNCHLDIDGEELPTPLLKNIRAISTHDTVPIDIVKQNIGSVIVRKI